ncbi:MAG: division/cell wall cluster transcriptional repressor MraZ [Paracoccus sp. (in: a-proteobacteria)]|nr:division/cell wall cluster transcriptional repressor MraZ [Paracoccus sp. (in: a-proteobacteria)]
MARKFRGSEEVNIDAKGRLSVPARFRRVFEQGDPNWKSGERAQIVLVYGPESWRKLELYTVEAADRIDEEIDRLERGSPERAWLETLMNGQATELEIDTEGRLVLPQKLRAKIGLDKAAVFTAKGDLLEVWRPDEFEEADARLQQFMAERGEDFDPRIFLGGTRGARAEG